MRKLIRSVPLALAAALVVAFVAACGGGGGGQGSGKSAIVSSKKFTEQILLGEMYAQALEAKGYDVERKLNLGSEQVMDKSLIDGTIDVYPEYTGTALVAIVKDERGKRDTPEETYQVVADFYQNREPKMKMLTPAPFDNNYGIVATQEVAERYNLKTIDDLARESGNLRFSSYSEFQNRADGYPNMQKNYEGLEFKDIKLINDLGLRYKALAEGEADIGIGFTTDGQIASDQLVVLEDTKKIWPFYYPAPVTRQDFLDQNPDAEEILNSVSASLTAEKMRELNGAVDLNREDPEDIAQQHLEEAGLL